MRQVKIEKRNKVLIFSVIILLLVCAGIAIASLHKVNNILLENSSEATIEIIGNSSTTEPAQELRGTVKDATMNTLTVQGEDNREYYFGTEGVNISTGETGIVIGNPVTVSYHGKLDLNASVQEVELLSITVTDSSLNTENPEPTTGETEPSPPSASVTQKAQEILNAMTLEEKVGQMFIARCPEINSVQKVKEYNLGGYILFSRDFSGKTRDEIIQNIQSYQSAAKIPMFIGVDEEGGTVNRVSTNPNLRAVPLYGYPLETTPKMDKMAKNNELYVFKDVISPHAYTIGSLREVFTFHNYEAINKWYECNNLFDIMKKAGYKTYWLSNQETSGQWANVALAYANRCDYKKFTGIRQSYEKSYRADGELLPLLYEAMNNNSDKNFYVLHLMGCHGEYENRYTPDFAKFSDVDETKGIIKTQEAKTKRAQYDNAILYNDTIVTQVMEAFKDKDAIVIYMPDHGEEVYDLKNFNGHSDDNPTKSMLEIPFVIYTTETFKQKYPLVDAQIRASVDKKYMTDDLIHTILDITGIKTPEFQETRSIINPYYNQERKRIFLDKDYDNWQ